MKTDPILVATGIGKTFPGVVALDDVNLTVGRGEVHALLGENGAGKSTLLKILSGAQPSDGGSILFEGRDLPRETPLQVTRAGIVTIYQEFNLIPPLTVAENIFIGREPRRFGLVDHGQMRRSAKTALDRIGLSVPVDRLVSSLSVAEQQMVEIARALSMQSRLIIMDEPTAALSDIEVERLLSIVGQLRAEGMSVIYVTHRLKEVMRVCDNYTILRDGKFVECGAVSNVSEDQIIKLMVGRDIEHLFKQREEVRKGAIALRGHRLSSQANLNDPNATRVDQVSFEAFYGEILGIAGLVGAGRTELARLVFGADRMASGEIFLDEEKVSIRTPKDAIARGIALVTEDRKQQGCFLELSVKHNLSTACLDRITNRLGIVDAKAETELVEEHSRKLAIRMASAQQKIGSLSGGNQQKVLIARWLALAPKVLIVDEPTRGIDVGAKAQVHDILFSLADAGIAIIVISSELPEILTVSDRILTMCEGRLTGAFSRQEATEEKLMRAMTHRHTKTQEQRNHQNVLN